MSADDSKSIVSNARLEQQPVVMTAHLDMFPSWEAPLRVPDAPNASTLATEVPHDVMPTDSDSEPSEVDALGGPGAEGVRRVVWLPISSLVPGKNGRGGASKDVADLVEVFKLRPQLHNIVVRPIAGERNRYEIIAGHRRVEAQRQLGRRQVWAIVIAATDAEAEIYGLEENLKRKPLDDELGATARWVALLDEQCPNVRGGDRKSQAYKSSVQLGQVVPAGVAAVAKSTGSSKGAVRRAVRIEKRAVAAVKEALKTGHINVNEADRLCRFDELQQLQELAALIESKARDRDAPVLKKIRASFEYLDSKLSTQQKGVTLDALQDFRARATALVEALDRLLAGSVT